MSQYGVQPGQGVGEVAPATFAQKQVAAGLDSAVDDASS